MKRAIVIGLLSCPGCASSVLLEAQHVSHPTNGWPVSANDTEDGLTQASVLLHWGKSQFYFDAGLGVNLQGKNGGGFYGSPLTFTGRAGYEIPLK